MNLGCIAIVKTSVLDPLYEDLPVWIVQDWKEVTRDNMQKLVKLLALTDDVTASAASIIPDLSPRDISPHAVKVIFPQYTPPAPPAADIIEAEQTSPARRRKREAEETEALPRRR